MAGVLTFGAFLICTWQCGVAVKAGDFDGAVVTGLCAIAAAVFSATSRIEDAIKGLK
jgi:hypothetical protein